MSNAAGLTADRPAAQVLAAQPVAIVVHYRGAEATLRCIVSLRAQRLRPVIVVVDNASPDGSGEVLARALHGMADVDLVRSPRNGGFGTGCNLGIEHALARWPECEHVLLLNPDATLAPHGLGEMVATMRRQADAGAVGCRIDGPDGQLCYGNGRWRPWTLSGSHGPAPTGEVEHRTAFVTGACMLLAADLLRSGLRFRADYFLYCEDMDLCREILARGRGLWVTQRASSRHEGGGSQPGEPVLGELTAERLYWLTRAKMLFARRWLRPWEFVAFVLVATVMKPMAGLALARSLRFLGPYWRGLRDGLRARLSPD